MAIKPPMSMHALMYFYPLSQIPMLLPIKTLPPTLPLNPIHPQLTN
jgi:hypothetical protein